MKTQSYYKLPTKVEEYALAVYHSKVVMIGGKIPSSQNQGRAVAPNGDPKYLISVLDDDCGLEERLNSALDRVPQESRHAYEIGKNACAVGEGDLLIVIGGDDSIPQPPWNLCYNQEHVRVFNGQNWSCGVISITERLVIICNTRKTLLVFQNHIYMTAYDNQVSFYCISMEYFRNQLDPTSLLSWNKLEDVPDGTACTNLSVLGNQLITVGVVDGRFRMYAYLSSSSEWIAVHEFQLSDMNSVSGIIGLQSSNSPSDQVEALIVGMGAYHQLTRICRLTTKCKLPCAMMLGMGSGPDLDLIVHYHH
jgi:hypothetical protein